MAKYFLLNQVHFGTSLLQPGTEVDGLQLDLVSLQASGALLIADTPFNRASVLRIRSLGLSSFETTTLLSNLSNTVVPSGGDDRLALQSAIDAAASIGSTLVLDGTYLVDSPGISWRSGLRVRPLDPSKRWIISPHASFAPSVASANDPSIALTSAAAIVAATGTTLSSALAGGLDFIKVVNAALLAFNSVPLAALDWISVHTTRAQGGDLNGETGAERYDAVQVRDDYRGGNTIMLATRLNCFHALGATVRRITAPMQNVSIVGGRLDASGGSMPELLRIESATNCEFDLETRGASNACIHSRFGSARNRIDNIDDGERNCAVLLESTHGTWPRIRSTGNGARFHRNGRIRAVFVVQERCNDVGLTPDSILRNGCTAINQRGAVTGGINGLKVDNMSLRERIQRPQLMYILPTAASDLLTLFARAASPNDTCEIRSGGRFMIATTTTLPPPLAAQTVYRAINATDTTIQVEDPANPGTPIDITAGGGGFGEMFIAERLVTVGPSSVLTCKAHGYVVGDELVFVGAAPSPTGISNAYYFVRSVPTPDTFTLSATQGGSLLAVAQDGSGLLSVSRQRTFPEDTFSRTGVVWVAAAGFECHGGGQPYGLIGERVFGFSIMNADFTNCYHPDRMGNQGVGLVVDVVSFYTNNVRVMNRGRTDLLNVPPGDDHMFGILHWDDSLITHNGLVVEGCEEGLIFVGGWQRTVFNGATLNGADGQSNPIWAIVNGMESAAGSSQPTDVVFNDVHFAGYAVPIAQHQSSWFAPTEYAWSRFRFPRFHMPGSGDLPLTYEDGRCAKNVSGGALAQGDIVQAASITDTNGYKLLSVTHATVTVDPEGTGVVMYNPVTWANNARCLVAFGSGVATIEAADTPGPGDKLYTQAASKKLTTTPGVGVGARAKGVCLGGKIANLAPFRCLT